MTDREIIELFNQKGQEEKAFRELLRSYQERLYWHIRRMVTDHDDADDVLQNAFLKIWRALPKFREESGLFTWLYRIATNEALSFLNQRKARYSARVDDPDQILLNRLEGDEYFDGDAARTKLYAVIETLPAKQKQVFQMKYFEEMPYQAMADILQTSVGALKASYHHAVKKIEHALNGD